MKFSLKEQETTIVYDAYLGEWLFYTSVPVHIRFFTSKINLLKASIEVLTEHDSKPTSIRFKVNKDLINVRKIIKYSRKKKESL